MFANGAVSGAFAAAAKHASESTKGKGRELTDGEIELAEKYYGKNIDYDRVRIYGGKYTVFQQGGRAMAPDGNIYVGGVDIPDFSVDQELSAVFVHEMMHVHQYQSGVNVIFDGLVTHAASAGGSFYDPYDYTSGWKGVEGFNSLNIEQQALFYEDLFRFNNGMNMYHRNHQAWDR